MLVPTRELALQTSAIVKEISKHLNTEVMVSSDIPLLRHVPHLLSSGPSLSIIIYCHMLMEDD